LKLIVCSEMDVAGKDIEALVDSPPMRLEFVERLKPLGQFDRFFGGTQVLTRTDV
jgi:hypothetical protein